MAFNWDNSVVAIKYKLLLEGGISLKNKKILIGVIISILVIVAIVALVYLYIQNKNEEKVTTLGKIELLVVDQTDQPDKRVELLWRRHQSRYHALQDIA